MWDIIVNNPAAKVKPPRAESPEIAVYTEEEVSLLLAAVEKDLLIKKVQLWLAVTTGARLGEIMGLKWTDFKIVSINVRKNPSRLPTDYAACSCAC